MRSQAKPHFDGGRAPVAGSCPKSVWVLVAASVAQAASGSRHYLITERQWPLLKANVAILRLKWFRRSESQLLVARSRPHLHLDCGTAELGDENADPQANQIDERLQQKV